MLGHLNPTPLQSPAQSSARLTTRCSYQSIKSSIRPAKSDLDRRIIKHHSQLRRQAQLSSSQGSHFTVHAMQPHRNAKGLADDLVTISLGPRSLPKQIGDEIHNLAKMAPSMCHALSKSLEDFLLTRELQTTSILSAWNGIVSAGQVHTFIWARRGKKAEKKPMVESARRVSCLLPQRPTQRPPIHHFDTSLQQRQRLELRSLNRASEIYKKIRTPAMALPGIALGGPATTALSLVTGYECFEGCFKCLPQI